MFPVNAQLQKFIGHLRDSELLCVSVWQRCKIISSLGIFQAEQNGSVPLENTNIFNIMSIAFMYWQLPHNEKSALLIDQTDAIGNSILMRIQLNDSQFENI